MMVSTIVKISYSGIVISYCNINYKIEFVKNLLYIFSFYYNVRFLFLETTAIGITLALYNT